MKTDLHTALTNLIKFFETSSELPRFMITIGFDGFVDEIIEVVDKRHSVSYYEPIETIADLGRRISNSAGLSTNIELVPTRVKLGGNGPNMANALAAVNQRITYIGALGVPEIHPVFHEMVSGCENIVSFANPGHTDALEFNDGKIMMGKLTPLNEVTWENLAAKLEPELLRKAFTEADLVATLNWTMLPYMNDLWHHLYQFLSEQEMVKRPYLFVDLCDPEKRSREDLLAAVDYLRNFSQFYNVVLGLNRKEADEVAKALGLNHLLTAEVPLGEITQELAAELQLWGVAVHAVKSCAAVCGGVFAEINGPYCAKPKLTTGAGDNFNAGFCLGLLLNLPLSEVLTLASAWSGFYVRRGFSADFEQMQDFLDWWLNNTDISL